MAHLTTGIILKRWLCSRMFTKTTNAPVDSKEATQKGACKAGPLKSVIRRMVTRLPAWVKIERLCQLSCGCTLRMKNKRSGLVCFSNERKVPVWGLLSFALAYVLLFFLTELSQAKAFLYHKGWKHELKMNPLKCAFGVSSGKFLGGIQESKLTRRR